MRITGLTAKDIKKTFNLINEKQIENEIGYFMPMFQGTATNKLSMVDAKKIKIDGFGKTIFEEKDFKILFSDEVDKERGLKANFRVSTQKLLVVAIMELTRQNHYKSTSNLNTMVTFSLKDYAKK